MQQGNTAPCVSKYNRSLPILQSVLTLSLLSASAANAGGPVFAVDSHLEETTALPYTVDGVSYLWGVGQNQILDGFFYNGNHHSEVSSADRVELQRVDIPGSATGNPCGLFAEYDGDVNELVANYPLGASGNCDMAAALASRVINRGTLDTFSNIGPSPKNIERVDFIYEQGTLASLSDAGLDVSGHIIAEKHGNNPVQIAAITALDNNGKPLSYGPLLMVNAAGCAAPEMCYGITAVRHEYSFLQSASVAPQNYAVRLAGGTENMSVAFASNRDLGLSSAQRYYGFSLFGSDVNASAHNLSEPSSFPQDTADNFITTGDGADLYGGMASTYWDDNADTASVGRAVQGDTYIDQNHNGKRDDSDVGLGGIDVSLYLDSDNNGIFDPAIDEKLVTTTTNNAGRFVFPGVIDGNYFALADENSDGIPANLLINDGSNPIGFGVSATEPGRLSFAFNALMSDGAVSAEADDANVQQDTSTTIDVLANDSDPVGSGLSITAVSSAAHGTVQIVGDQVVYTPNSGYTGADSFSYTATDGSGTESTAAVSVTVLRFSDINHNGVDDYEECGCDDIRLVTGVNGSSVGGGNGLWLLLLVPVVAFRRIAMRKHGVPA